MPAYEFRYVGEVACFDLVNTAKWRDGQVLEEGLDDYDRVVEWAEGADVVSASLAGDLREHAAAHPREARAALAAVRDARRTLRDLFAALAAGGEPEALPAFNALLGEALGHLQIALTPPAARGGARGGAWAWRGMRSGLDTLLWPVLWSAARLLASGEATAIRVCAGEDCGWTYVDRSRNGFRRWCEMETCGTREKSRRRAERARRATARR